MFFNPSKVDRKLINNFDFSNLNFIYLTQILYFQILNINDTNSRGKQNDIELQIVLMVY
jgi:hypothetical protein